MGRLFIVGTPIGNLEDLSPRAQRILSSVSLIACEDTRVTKKLLMHFKIATPTASLHQHSGDQAMGQLLDRVEQGSDIVYLTDAGMPTISDPGGKLIASAHSRGLKIESVPGPSAVTTALSLSGWPADTFLFLGFLPHKKGRQTLLKRIAETEETVVLYESPHRLLKFLEEAKAAWSSRPMAVCRELTKLHESVQRGTAAELLDYFNQHADQVRGEITIVIAPKP